jgi:hypothetical protein
MGWQFLTKTHIVWLCEFWPLDERKVMCGGVYASRSRILAMRAAEGRLLRITTVKCVSLSATTPIKTRFAQVSSCSLLMASVSLTGGWKVNLNREVGVVIDNIDVGTSHVGLFLYGGEGRF